MPKSGIFSLAILFVMLLNFSSIVSADYEADVYFTMPYSVYLTNETMPLKGYVYLANFTNGTSSNASTALVGATVNLSIISEIGIMARNYTFVTDGDGAFYSKSNFYPNATEVLASLSDGIYMVRAEYVDPENVTYFSEVEISVFNESVDSLSVSTEKASYNAGESIVVVVDAVRKIGDRVLPIANVTISGSLRTSNKVPIENFSCDTGSNGECSETLSGISSYGSYIVEVENFKAFSSFSVVPFSFNVYMMDELGQSYKNVFAMNEVALIEVSINNASDSDSYYFSGYIADSSGSSVKAITSSTMNSNNSFTNSFSFTVDTLTFGYGSYTAYVTVYKTGDGSINASASFEVKDWTLDIKKRDISSGFEYEYSAFPNKTLNMEAVPTFRTNGSVISNISSDYFTINVKDDLNNVIRNSTATWNASCGNDGCYGFNFTSPLNYGAYTLSVTLSYNGLVQTETRVINVIDGVMSAQSTDKDGAIKELFGANEFVYLSLSAYNVSNMYFNLSDAVVSVVSYMNGTDLVYTQVGSFDNVSNSSYQWAWNATSQRIKMSVPKVGGLYNVYLFGQNNTMGALAKFIVNPYDVCMTPKNKPGQTDTNNFYTWQFQTRDTVYFDIKLMQANNPSGRATASNSSSGNGSMGMGMGCTIGSTRQAVSNATFTVVEVWNLESGSVQSINTTASICQSGESSGAYSCIVKPLTKWEGGPIIVKFNIVGDDGTSSVTYSRFEARAFYLNGWSSTWQNNPSSNITLNLWMYSVGGSNGVYQKPASGKVVVKKIESLGKDGEWIWPPVDSGYNVSNLSPVTISSSSSYSSNSITLPVTYTQTGVWKTGNYRVVLQATTDGGDVDYGYAWFGVKLWDVYGQPVECTSTTCNYKNYFNSRENVSLFISISKAGSNGWNYGYSGGQDIYGNVTVWVKKLEDCRTWPCKELNSSQYTSTRLNVNSSSPYLWTSNLTSAAPYILSIVPTSGTWGTGYYNVILNVNNTDTGYAWFNTLAFYVETQPTNSGGVSYVYNIRGNGPMYFNVTTTNNYKWNYYGGARYNLSDYVNTTVDDIVLRTWDQTTRQQKEYNYPEDINVTSRVVNGNALLNMSYLSGSWPSGYYWGELVMKNSANETSSGWLGFNVQPFRVDISGNSYYVDSDQCVNTTLRIYEPDWSSSSTVPGNYSVMDVYEEIWTGGNIPTVSHFTNYSVNGVVNGTFNATATVNFCPSNGSWGTGSWGGYHYLNVKVRDNSQNTSQLGWLYFKTSSFQVSWGSVSSNVRTNSNINTTVRAYRPSTSADSAGILTGLYQWRYSNSQSTRENYVFSVGNASTGICFSNVSSSGCRVNGTQNIVIYGPSGGWMVGWNYLQAEWEDTSGNVVQDWNGIGFSAVEAYSGGFSNWWYNGANYVNKYDIAVNENMAINLYVRDSSNNYVDVNVTSVYYAYSGDNCWSDYCRTYTNASFTKTSLSTGSYVINITVPATNWTVGRYTIKATVSGSSGTANILNGEIKVKDYTPPTINFTSPANNATYNRSLLFSATTSESANCYLTLVNYDNFFNWNCNGWTANSSNSSNSSSVQVEGACNSTRYNYNGSVYYYEYVAKDYHGLYNNTAGYYCYSGGCYSWGGADWQSRTNTFMNTDGRSHTYTFNVVNATNQSYGMQLWCYDNDYNYATALGAFRVNNSIT